MLAALLLASACATRPGAEALVPVSAEAAGAKRVTVLVATDRGPDGPPAEGTGVRRAELRYEELTISVPPGHEAGRIEWSERQSRDPAKSFVVVARRPLDEAGFAGRVAAREAADGAAGIFVHGYNYTLPEAAFRLAQLSADAPSVGTPILFSWPSEAAITGYVADRDGATYARDDLAHLLQLVGATRTKGRIVLAGHSMGGWLVMEALRQLRLEGRDAVIGRYEVALAAPDVDVDVFRRQLSVIGPLDPPMTILVSKDDRALGVSRGLAGGHQRAGAVDVDDPRLQEIARRADLRIVDISSIEPSDGSRHDRFVRFATFQSKEMAGEGKGANALRQAGAFVFNAAGAAVASPFTLAGRALAGP